MSRWCGKCRGRTSRQAQCRPVRCRACGATVAIASGLATLSMPIVAPFNLGIGSAITVSPALLDRAEIEGDRLDPMATALALSLVVAERRE